VFELTPELLAQALGHGLEELPRESCGLVAGGTYHRCRNLSADPDCFIIDPSDYRAAAALGPITLVVHSHPRTGPEPSPQDRAACDVSGLPWLIVQPQQGRHVLLEPRREPLPLLGRPWVWGATDCWALVRDWFRQERGITLPDYPRPPTPEEFHARPLFDELWPSFGFRAVEHGERPEPGDVVLMSIAGPGLNHVGVLLEGGQILHHLRGRLSARELYGGWLQKCTGRLVRYVGPADEDHPAVRAAG
jgi:proteasome lid subunit RPN8/RPN11